MYSMNEPRYDYVQTLVFNITNPVNLVAGTIANSTVVFTFPPGIDEWYLLGFQSHVETFDTAGDYFNKYRSELWTRYAFYDTNLIKIGDIQKDQAGFGRIYVYMEGNEQYSWFHSPIYFPTSTITILGSFLIQNYAPAGNLRTYHRFNFQAGIIDKEKKAYEFSGNEGV